MFWFFELEACGILAPQPGIEPTPPAVEGEVLTIGLPGKSPHLVAFSCHVCLSPQIWDSFSAFIFHHDFGSRKEY